MTTTQTDRLMAMFDDAIESSRLQGGTDAKKGFGIYTEEDSRFNVAMYKSIAEKRAALLAALQALDPQVAPHLQFTAYHTDDTQAGTL